MQTAEGSIRAARLTDRPALVGLSQRVHGDPEGFRRSLGVPAPSATRSTLALSSLMPHWLPLRPPSVHLVAESDGRLVGSARAIEEPHSDNWAIIELDAEEGPMAVETRHALLRGLIDEGMEHGVARLFAACADVRENLTLFGGLAFAAYAQEEIWYHAPQGNRGAGGGWLRGLMSREGGSAASPGADGEPALQPAGAPDAWHLFDLWSHATPPAIARIERYAAGDWEAVGHEGVVPRSSLNPLMHFSAVSAWLMPDDQRAAGFAQHGATREGPHYLRYLVRDRSDGGAFLRAALRACGPEAAAAGILAPVRTYESAGLRAAADTGFTSVGTVTLLVREVPATVRQPAMMPAV